MLLPCCRCGSHVFRWSYGTRLTWKCICGSTHSLHSSIHLTQCCWCLVFILVTMELWVKLPSSAHDVSQLSQLILLITTIATTDLSVKCCNSVASEMLVMDSSVSLFTSLAKYLTLPSGWAVVSCPSLRPNLFGPKRNPNVTVAYINLLEVLSNQSYRYILIGLTFFRSSSSSR